MKRPVVLALLAVLAAVAVYLLVFRGDDDGAKASDTRSEARPDRQDAPITRTPAPPPRRDSPEDVVRDSPASGAPVIRTREDGSTVRDHRKNADAEWVRPALPHPSMSPVSAVVTSTVMRQVRPVVLECMRKVPDSAYGTSPVVVTRAEISIDGEGNLRVAALGPALRDIDPTAAAAALECIRAAAPTLSGHVEHEAVPSATLSLTIRPLDYR